MRISKINNTNIKAGSVNTYNLNPKNLLCYDALSKIAEDRQVDIYITKHNGNKQYLPLDNLYTIVAYSEKQIQSIACAIINKKNNINETSTKIFNAAMNAIETLNKKLKTTII